MSLGRGVDLKDQEEVKEYLKNLGIEYRFGCYHEKNPKACHLLGDYLEAVSQDFAHALRVYLTNCDVLGYAHSCHKVGGYKSVGRACDIDHSEALAYFEKGCEKGYHNACLNAGLVHILALQKKTTGKVPVEGSHIKAVEFFKKACDAGENAEACHRYSSFYVQGVPGVIEPDMKEAFTYAVKGCALGNMMSCLNTSVMYKKGEGTEKDEAKAKMYADTAQEMYKQLRGLQPQLRFGES